MLRHAQARHFKARLTFESGEVRLTFSDDGRGFDHAGRHEGFGLRGIAERVDTMGGQLSIQSESGKGTTISIALPFPKTKVL
jgi:signal transduction histidine kinase